MDNIRLIDNMHDLELLPWQKEYFKLLSEKLKDGKTIVLNRKGYGVFVYPDLRSIKEMSHDNR